MITWRAPRTGLPIVDGAFRELERLLLSFRKVVTNEHLISVTFSAANTDTPVTHGLGAPVLTFDVVDKTADVRVWRSATVNARPSDVIILRASSAPATVLVRFA